MMESTNNTSRPSKIDINFPGRILNMYGDFVTKNASAVGQIEGALRSLTYIIPGRFRESDIASESLNSGVQLLALYHDSLLSRILENTPKRQQQHQTPHTRYTRHFCQKSPMYRRTALMLQVIQYTELLLEMMAKRRGDRARWRVVVLLESIKALCRLLLMRLTRSRPLLNPPLPEREMPDQPVAVQDAEGIVTPPSEPSEAGSEQWTMPRTSLTLPPLPSGDDISNYLLSKVLTADDVKPPKALLHRTAGLGEIAEVMYILRPVIYATAMAYWCQRKDSRGKADWRPWLIGFSIEYGARQLAKKDLQMRRPGGQKGLTQLEKEELNKRGWGMAWWAMRGAFYENITSGVIRGVSNKLKGKPLLDMVGNIIEDYDFLWDQYYFPTATL